MSFRVRHFTKIIFAVNRGRSKRTKANSFLDKFLTYPWLHWCKKSIPVIFGTVLFVSLSIGSKIYTKNANSSLLEPNLERLARSITVRVFSAETEEQVSIGGSGIIIEHRGSQYKVLTNYHVIANNHRFYQIQTHDGQFYPAQIINIPFLVEDDISFLTFESPDRAYNCLPLKSGAHIAIGDPVLSAGFPFDEDLSQSQQPYFTSGQVDRILERPLVGGYQIGYSNLVKIGMSGGPLLNYQGELVGINGLGKHPLFGNPYVFKDGASVVLADWARMRELSWAIPIESIFEKFFTKKAPSLLVGK